MWANITRWTLRYGAFTDAELEAALRVVGSELSTTSGFVHQYTVKVNATTVMSLALYDSRAHGLAVRESILPRVKQMLQAFLVTFETMDGEVLTEFEPG